MGLDGAGKCGSQNPLGERNGCVYTSVPTQKQEPPLVQHTHLLSTPDEYLQSGCGQLLWVLLLCKQGCSAQNTQHVLESTCSFPVLQLCCWRQPEVQWEGTLHPQVLCILSFGISHKVSAFTSMGNWPLDSLLH